MKSKKSILFIVLLLLLFPTLYFVYDKYSVWHIGRPDIAIRGPILMADGIGRQTVELAQILKKKYKVQITSKFIKKKHTIPKDIKKLINAKYTKPAQIVLVEESLWSPGNPLNRFFSTVTTSDQIRYAYTMLESTQIIPEWVMMINLYFDAIIVPDQFLISAYQKSGVTVPIFYIPLGLDLKAFLKQPLKEPKTQGPLVFACLGSGIERKNHKMAIEAFAKALGNNENARLYINCRYSEPETRNEIVAEINRHHCNNIHYTEICLTQDAYLKFFKSIDCLLSLSKGEGFSIQPREAMALGIPVILTDNTAQSTICKSGLVKVVSSTIAEPRHYFKRPIPDGEHFNCSLEEAVSAIQDVYLNYSMHASKAALMREWAAEYDYENLAKIYTSLVAPQKISLGDVNEITKDGITTNSKEFYEKYLKITRQR